MFRTWTTSVGSYARVFSFPGDHGPDAGTPHAPETFTARVINARPTRTSKRDMSTDHIRPAAHVEIAEAVRGR
jgi:hypothetical protein